MATGREELMYRSIEKVGKTDLMLVLALEFKWNIEMTGKTVSRFTQSSY